MKALIFAAGLGERMRPLTDVTAKPLLKVAGKPLIVWHLEKLAQAGIAEVIINTSWLAAQFPQTLGDGSDWGLRIQYLYEGPTPLETGGGMLNALPLLGTQPFLLVNGDIWSDYDFSHLPQQPSGLAHLVMVDPPGYATHGDFALDQHGHVRSEGPQRLTYAGIGVYQPALLHDWQQQLGTEGYQLSDGKPRFRLAPLLRAHMDQHPISGEHHRGRWTDVGTPERLQQLEESLADAL